MIRGLVTAVLILSLQIVTVQAHVRLLQPCPRAHPFCNTNYPEKDYDLSNPAKAVCGGKAPGPITTTLTAGSSLNVQFEFGAPHGGGGCVFSISNDQSKSFTVIAITSSDCPQTANIQIQVPDWVPACEAKDQCVFAWSWMPKLSGGPEYYMNCVDVIIQSNVPAGTSMSGKGPLLQFMNMDGYTIYQDPNRALFTNVYGLVNGVIAVLEELGSTVPGVLPPPVTPLLNPVQAPTTTASSSTTTDETYLCAPTNPVTGAIACTAGQYTCLDANTLGQCNFGTFASHTCPTGTKCRMSGPDMALCDWPTY